MNKKRRVVVTGGAGFIGTNVVFALLEKGYSVTVVDSLCSGSVDRVSAVATLEVFDIADTTRLAAVCTGAEAVVHLAALPRVQFSIDNPTVAHEVNVGGTLSVLEACREAGVKRLVFASSSSVYGDQTNMPLTETMAAKPMSPYALHKYIGEQYLGLWHLLYGLETVSLRLFNVYGPHFDPNGPYALVIGRFLQLAKKGQPLTVTGTGMQTRDFVHVQDVAAAIVAALRSVKVGSGEVINIGSGKETSINDLATVIGGIRTYVAARNEPQRTQADIVRARELLGWQPAVALVEGVTELKREFGLL